MTSWAERVVGRGVLAVARALGLTTTPPRNGRATVLKLALMRGLELLEQEHGSGGAEAPKRGRKVASP